MGTPKLRAVSSVKPRSRSTTARASAPRNRLASGLSATMAVMMPALAVAGTRLAGSLAPSHPGIAGLVGVTVGTVLAVSLHHCASALRQTIGLPLRSSVALAIALDCAVVSSELTDTLAPEVGLHGVCLAVMAGIGAISAALNLITFRAYRSR